MCGRFVRATPPDQMAAYFGAGLSETLLAPSYNVAPTNDVYAVTLTADGRMLEVFHWGLVPMWAKDIKVGSRMINARSETIAESNAFKVPFRIGRRCLVPVDGFYEWQVLPPDQLPLGELGQAKPGKVRKQPMYIRREDGEPLAFAGLYEIWRGPKEQPLEEPLHSATILTTSANETMAPIHDRMPVILPPSAWDAWLDPANTDLAGLRELLVPAPPRLLTAYPVSTSVNNVRSKGPELIEPV